MKKQMNKNKGITLIALVVTIIVLLILAAVSISMLTGENGIIRQAQHSKENTDIGNEKEIVNLAAIGAKIKDEEGKIKEDNLKDELDKLIGEGKYDLTGVKSYTVTYKESGRSYIVEENGEITQVTDPNIFKYTIDGYITGVKDEYIEAVTSSKGKLHNSKKYASINNIKISSYQDPQTVYYLKEEVGTELYIPTEIEGTKIIGIADSAFFAIYNLTKVIIPGEIKEIGSSAFECCVVLECVELQNGIEKLDSYCFRNCFDLNDINLPDSLIEVGDFCFYQVRFTEIYIPQNIEIIGEIAFPYMDKIYCEVDKKPDGWDYSWNRGLVSGWSPVEWGVSR